MSRPRRSCALALVVGTLGGCSGERPRERPVRPVRVETVTGQAVAAGLRYSASIQPYEQVARAFKVGGYVREVLQRPGSDGRPRDLQAGDEVAAGTVLARIDEADYQERANQARALLAEADAGVRKARADAERAERLYRSKTLTRPEYDAASSSLEATTARAAGARAQLAAAELALRDCALVAPMNAVVLSRNVQAGTLAAAGTVAFVLADLTRVKAAFGVPEGVMRSLSPGAWLPVTSDALGSQRLQGRISAISPSADAQSRVFGVEVEIPNPRRQLKAGMIATVEVAAPAGAELTAGTATVSVAAIVRSPRGAGYAVFVAEGSGEQATARARDVSLGGISGNRVAVKAGLAVGERVIVTGASLLADGEAVRIVPGGEGE